MPIKTYNATSSGMRQLALVDKSLLYKGHPCKQLTHGIAKTGGRNNQGVITVRAIGGGHKRKYRVINFHPDKTSGNAEVLRIEFDPNRSAFIALIRFDDGVLNYVLASTKMEIGTKISIGPEVAVADGNTMKIKNIPIGFNVYAVEMKPCGGAQIARAAGSYVTIMGRDGSRVLIRLRSGISRYISGECFATIGIASNLDRRNVVLGKAGRSRFMGRRPKVRGVAMNPIDHPHGGGEGKSGTGGPPVTPWGKLTKGAKTVKRKKRTKVFGGIS